VKVSGIDVCINLRMLQIMFHLQPCTYLYYICDFLCLVAEILIN